MYRAETLPDKRTSKTAEIQAVFLAICFIQLLQHTWFQQGFNPGFEQYIECDVEHCYLCSTMVNSYSGHKVFQCTFKIKRSVQLEAQILQSVSKSVMITPGR